MSLPLISIIVPVYNVKKYLPACLDSLKAQTYRRLEIIFIDDGSTDGSSTLLKAYCSLDRRAKIIRQKNSGLSRARNAGLDAAKGKYVLFLDSDDSLAKDAVEYLYKLIEKSGSAISVCPHFLQKETGEPKSFNVQNYKTEKLPVSTALRHMLNEAGFNLQITPKLFLRSLFEKSGQSPAIRFPENKLHEDVGTTYRLFLRAVALNPSAKVAFGSRAKYFYNVRGTSITNAGFSLKKLDLIIQTDAMCAEISTRFPELENTTNLRRMHARFSILRQIIQKTHKTEREEKIENTLNSFLLEHKSWILKNPEATSRDKFAMLTLLLGKSFFKFAWSVYGFFVK